LGLGHRVSRPGPGPPSDGATSYDALRTHRPYRNAWESGATLDYIRTRAGSEFDPAIADAFVRMMREWDNRVVVEAA
jgi:HD-GYP domain-containing protein (c-di-GMP phosphodiesterase class II)